MTIDIKLHRVQCDHKNSAIRLEELRKLTVKLKKPVFLDLPLAHCIVHVHVLHFAILATYVTRM